MNPNVNETQAPPEEDKKLKIEWQQCRLILHEAAHRITGLKFYDYDEIRGIISIMNLPPHFDLIKRYLESLADVGSAHSGQRNYIKFIIPELLKIMPDCTDNEIDSMHMHIIMIKAHCFASARAGDSAKRLRTLRENRDKNPGSTNEIKKTKTS